MATEKEQDRFIQKAAEAEVTYVPPHVQEYIRKQKEAKEQEEKK